MKPESRSKAFPFRAKFGGGSRCWTRTVGLLLGLLAATNATSIAAQNQVTSRTLHQGTAVIAYSGTDAGQGGTGLRLMPVGVWKDARSTVRYSIWKIRNAGAADRPATVRVAAAGFAASLRLPARSETFLRSPVLDAAYRHELVVDGLVVASEAPSATVWNSAQAVLPARATNTTPQLVSVPSPVVQVDEVYRYAPIVDDPDGDLAALSVVTAPAGFSRDAATGQFTYRPSASAAGEHPVTIRIDDGRTGAVEQTFVLRVRSAFCPIAPLAISQAALTGQAPGSLVSGLGRGTGSGQFTAVAWVNDLGEGALRASLLPPGNSDSYINPDQPTDLVPSVADWLQTTVAQVAPSDVTALVGRELVLPTWDQSRGAGVSTQVRVAGFVRARITAVSLGAAPTMSFEYLGVHRCGNRAPSVVDAAISTRYQTPVAIVLSASDDPGETLTYAVVGTPTKGVISGTAPNLTYTPNAGFQGTDRIHFTASDGDAVSETAEIAITVAPPNRAPVANAQTVPASEDSPATITLTGSDPDGDPLSFRIVRAPARGDLTGTPPNLTYTPRANLSGDDELYFRTSDGTLESPSARVLIQVAPVNDPPTATPFAASTDEDQALPVRLLGTDVDSPTLAFEVVAGPTHGTLTGTSPNLVYTPASNFNGSDAFTYRSNDGVAASAPAVVQLTVRPKNDAPRITSIAPLVVVPGVEYRYDVDATDIDGDVLRFELARSPVGLTVDPGTGLIRWTPGANETYPAEVIVDALDPAGLFDKQRFLLAPGAGNQPPSFTTTPPTTATVGQSFTYDANATDPDGDPLTFTVVTAPAGAAINATTGIVTWTPTAAQVGSQTLTLRVSDGRGGTAEQTGTIVVAAANQPPSFTTTPPTGATVGMVYTYDANATDPDGDPLSFTVVTAPAGAAINATTGIVTWTPTAAQVGSQTLTLRVSDGRGGTEEQTGTIVVAAANQPPSFTTTPPTGATVGMVYTYDTNATDPDGDSLSYAIVTAPVGAVIDATTGIVTWTPTAAQVGSRTLTLRVSDGRSGTAEQSGTITVVAANQAPSFTTTPPTSATVGQAYVYDANATDPDGDSLSYAIVTAPAGVAIDSTTGIVTWTPTAAQVGSQTLTLRVSDGRGGTAEQSGTINVVAANQPPSFTTTPPTSATVGQAYVYDANATDPEGDSLSYAIVTAPAGAAIDATTGIVTWTPTAAQVGSQPLTLRVSDGRGGTAEQSGTINVVAANQPPSFTTTPPTSATVGQAFNYDVNAIDPDSDPLAFSIVAAPAGATIDAATGIVSWTPTVAQIGPQTLTLRVSDGRGGTAEQSGTIAVVAANEPPSFTTTPPAGATVGQAYVYDANATDPDGDPLSFTVVTAPAGAVIDATTGIVTWTPTAAQVGSQTLTLRVSDGRGGTAEQTGAIVVAAANQPPSFTTTPPTSATVGQAYVYDANATDPDGDPLTFTVVTAPAGAAINATTGIVTWTPTADQVGSQTLTLRVSDGRGGTAEQTGAVVVAAANQPPSFTTTPPTGATVGQAFTYDANATDPDSDPLTFSIVAAPAGATIDAATGIVSWTPTVAQIGPQTITLRVSDGRDGSAEQTGSITVGAANQPPSFTTTPPTVAFAGSEYTYDADAIDPDGDDVTFVLEAGPPGLTLDATSGLVTWVPASEGTFTVRLAAIDGRGGDAIQNFTVTVSPPQPVATNRGTAFWLMFMANSQFDSNSPQRTVSISAPTGADVTVEAPGIGFTTTVTIAPGGLQRVDVPVAATHTAVDAVRSLGVRVTASQPVVVTAFNLAAASSDGFLALPDPALGRSHRIISFDGWHPTLAPGILAGVVATENATTVTFVSPVDWLRADRTSVPAGQPVQIVLQRGETFLANFVAGNRRRGSSGARVFADKPIAVYSGAECTGVPFEFAYCDHHVEQNLPDEALGFRFSAVSVDFRRRGDLFRILATEADTRVQLNGIEIATLGAGEFVDRIVDGSVRIITDRPAVVAQFPTSAEFHGVSTRDSSFLLVPPEEVATSSYVFSTAGARLTANGAYLILDPAIRTSLRLDGLPVTAAGPEFELLGTNRIGIRITFAEGTHSLTADGPFLATYYGFGRYEGSAYPIGMRVGTSPAAPAITLAPRDQQLPVGAQACVRVTLTEGASPSSHRRWRVSVSGTRSLNDGGFTGEDGSARYCWRSPVQGRDTLTFSSAGLTASASVRWIASAANSAPVILSTPIHRPTQRRFDYTVVARDPDGDPVTYSVPVAPVGLSIDPAGGAISWTPPTPSPEQPAAYRITVRATDPSGAFTEQPFVLSVPDAPAFQAYPQQEVTYTNTYYGRVDSIGGDPQSVGVRTIAAPVGTEVRRAVAAIGNSPLPDQFDAVWRPELSDVGQFASEFNPLCRRPASDIDGLWPKTVWQQTGVGALGLPVVGRIIDTNADGVVDTDDDLAIVAVRNGYLVALNSRTGSTLWTNTTEPFTDRVVPAVSDLDGDGAAEILVGINGNQSIRQLLVLEGTGQRRWLASTPIAAGEYRGTITSIQVADILPGSPGPEIVAGPVVYSSTGQALWSFTERPSMTNFAAFLYPLLSDLDADGAPEVIFRNEVRSADGTLRFSLDSIAGVDRIVANFAVVQADADPGLELVAMTTRNNGPRALFLINADGSLVWGPLTDSIQSSAAAGVPEIADLDGDGRDDIYLPQVPAVVYLDGPRVVSMASNAFTPNYGTLIDLNGDGRYETSPREGLLFVDAATGYEWTRNSGVLPPAGTSNLPPIAFADLDNDGEGEAIIAYADTIAVFRSANVPWQAPTQLPNQFRVAAMRGEPAVPAKHRSDEMADLYVSAPKLSTNGDQFTARFLVANRGTAVVSTGIDVELWSGAPTTGTRLATVQVDRLNSAEQREIRFDGLLRNQLGARLYARVMANNPIAECETRNNVAFSHLFEYELFDGNGYAARHTTLVAVNQNDLSPRFETTAPVDALVGAIYRYQPLVTTQAVGSGLRFELRNGPDGMAINALTGEIRWTPSAAQLGSHTLQIYVFDINGRFATQSITITVAADGSNRPPLITSKGPRDARPGSFYVYDLEAHDPDLDVLSYRFTGATPPGMQIDAATGRVTWSVPASQFGGAAFTVEVTDGRGGVATQFTSMGIYPTVLNMAPYFTSAPPTEAREGEPYAYAPTTGDPDGDPVVVTVASAPPGAVLGGDGVLRWTPAVDQLGRQLIRLTATDDDGATALQDAWIDVTSSSGPLTVAISGLDDDVNEITRPEAISGVVSGEDIREWRLAVRPSNSPDAVPEFIATGTSGFNGGTIGTFDPTLRMNGMYTVILQAWRNDGQTASDSRVLRVTGDMKVGHFSMAFEDVSVNVAGLPVRVTRTYDTRQRAEPLDFGFGWSVDYQNVRLRESRKMGFSWYTVPQQLSTCVRANGDPTVTVTLPDGEVHSFRARAVPECVIGGQAFVSLGFTPTDGTDSTLEQTSYGLLRIVDVVGTQVKNLVDIDDLTTPVDPRFYRLTTPEGVVYEIDQNFGVRRVIEPNGQSLTYTAEAITHSTGVEIDIVRDSEGRISDLVLPDGEVLSYTYTAAGDLESFTDELDRVTTFGYTSVAHPHYLTEIVDPRGVRVARNEYDDEGRLVRTIDADGNVIAFEHALGTQTETVRDRNGNATLYVYDDEGRVLTETNALNETITRTYDADGNVLTETNALGQTTTSTYDPRGNRLTETNALGETTRSTYDARNNLLTQTDGSGTVVMRNTYAAVRSNNLTRTEDALGNATQFVYDGDTGEMLRMTDALNRETRYELDPRGWRVGETDPLGVETRYSYDFQGRVRTETRTRVVNGATQSLVTRYTYDAAGNLTRTEHPDGSVTTTEYNAIDKPSRECDALTRCTEHTYDARGNPLRTTYPDGTYEETSYDANGNTIAQRDRGGRTTRMTYDAANRLVETIHPDAVPASGDDGNPANNPRTRNEYDRAGRLLASVDPNGRRTEYRYDAAGRRTQVIEPAVDGSSATTVTTYDATGRRTAVTDALGRTARFVYDAAGRMTTTIHPDAGPDDGNDANNPRTVVDYDALGRKTVETDPDGRRTEYGYDPLGRLTSVVLAAGTPSATTTTYAYDEQGNRITQTDAEGRATRFTFDRIGRETSRTLPLGQVETKTWTAAGEPATLTDFNGRTTAWTHDTVGRVSTIDYPNDADVQFTYTDSGQRATVVDGHGTVTHVQDARDRLVRRTDAAGRVIEYTYDEAGNLTSRVTASQSLVYTYDARNRLTSVTQTVAGGTPRTTTYTYDAVGNRASMTGGDGTTTQYTYDRRNRLTQLVQRSAAAAVLFAASYTVDATGLRTGAQESDAGGVVRTLSWTYDALKRLTGESIDHRDDTRDRTSAWTYDRVGNRLTQVQTLGAGALAQTTTTTSTYDANDRLLTETVQTGSGPAQVTTTTYDAQGNTLTRSGPDGLVEYTWNDANRLVEQRTASGRTTYRYDADGLRIGQMHFPSTGTPTRTDYLVDPSFAYANVIERFEGAAGVGAAAPKLAQVYAFGEGIVGQTTCTPNAGSGVHDCPAAQERFVHADGFGSTRLVTDVSGVVTDRVDYDAWGNEIAREGTTAVEHLYRGEQFDPNLGWYYLRARYYLQSTGRFASMDSFEGFSTSPGSLHKYLYAHANPIMGRDPSGYLLVEEGLANTIMAKLAVSAVALAVTATTAGVLSLGPGPHINSPGARKNYSSALEANIAEQCARQQRGPDDCVSRMPTLFLGRDVSLHTMHVRAALDESSASPLLNYRNEQHPRRWLQYTAECKGRTGLGTGLDCDEYPYAASVQGGQANHRFGAVYLRPVLSADNQLAGNRLFHKLLSPCRIQQRGGSSPSPQFDGVSMFAVVPVLSQATTTGRCSDGTTIR